MLRENTSRFCGEIFGLQSGKISMGATTCQSFRLSLSLKCDPKPAMTSRFPNYLVKFNVENGR